jgi:hypothetical protein
MVSSEHYLYLLLFPTCLFIFYFLVYWGWTQGLMLAMRYPTNWAMPSTFLLSLFFEYTCASLNRNPIYAFCLTEITSVGHCAQLFIGWDKVSRTFLSGLALNCDPPYMYLQHEPQCLASLLLVYVNYTKGFYCYISIHSYNRRIYSFYYSFPSCHFKNQFLAMNKIGRSNFFILSYLMDNLAGPKKERGR